jgi:hypothetical protein
MIGPLRDGWNVKPPTEPDRLETIGEKETLAIKKEA